MTPDQRRESISLSQMSPSDQDKAKAYTLEEFSYDYFRCVSRLLTERLHGSVYEEKVVMYASWLFSGLLRRAL